MTSQNSLLIRSATTGDAAAVARIYNYYIAQTVVTFEVDSVSADEMGARIEKIQSDSYAWLVVERVGDVVGYAYAGRWNARCAYRYAAEATVYLDSQYTRQGLGKALYNELLAGLKRQGMHTVIGGISLPNPGSVALHEALGFQKVAHYREVGFKFGGWIDVGYWQRIL